MTYPALKAPHLICVVSWFAAMFYIFRLFVYHVQNWENEQLRQVLGTMERKLITYIMFPAGVASALSGIPLLLLNPAVAVAGFY